MNVDVVVVGGGPTGLLLACELAQAGVRPLVLEQLAEPSQEPKANGLLGQVVRLMDLRGLHEPMSGREGQPQPSPGFLFAAMPIGLGALPDNPLYAMPATQLHMTRVLEARALELGAEIRRGHRLVGLAQDDRAVVADVMGPEGASQVRARYLVGADGAHSATRKLAGIGFPGVTHDDTVQRTAHALVPAEWIDATTGALNVPGHGVVAPFVPCRTEHGTFSYAPLPGQPPLISTAEWAQPPSDAPMTLDELRASVRRVLGVEVPLEAPAGDGPHVLRRLNGGNTRTAQRFRDRRVLLAGDAAHVNAFGGSGLNLGLQDAANLGWKLAAEVRGVAPAGLLDSYEVERRAAAERMVVAGQAQTALSAPGRDVTGLRTLFGEMLGDGDTVRRLAQLIAGADVRYDMGTSDAHPLVGHFVPDLELDARGAAVRLAELARTARPLLLDLTADASAAGEVDDWQDRVEIVTGSPRDADPPATALLMRPDGYVAWASSARELDEHDRAALRAAAQRWFGPVRRDGRSVAPADPGPGEEVRP